MQKSLKKFLYIPELIQTLSGLPLNRVCGQRGVNPVVNVFYIKPVVFVPLQDVQKAFSMVHVVDRQMENVRLILMLIVFCYPLFSIAFGHYFPRVLFPGTLPCPTTALALVLLTTALPRVDKIIYFILLFYAIPFPPFIQIPKYGVYEDIIMLGVGIYSLIMLVTHWREKPALSN